MIYCLGESLMDIIFESGSQTVSKPGGAMLNLSVSLGRSNCEICLISELGDDFIGSRVLSFLTENSVNTKFITKYSNQTTSLALAMLDEQKKPKYSFYKTYPTLRKLVLPKQVGVGDFVVFGSLYSLDAAIRQQLFDFVKLAKQNGALIIYDPNIRNSHHLQHKNTFLSLSENLAVADIIKGSDDDFENIFGKFEEEFVLAELRKINSNATIVFTYGDRGSKLVSKNSRVEQQANSVSLVSTIGAGDNFTAGMIYYLSSRCEKTNPEHFSEIELKKLLRTATDFAADVCASYDNYVSRNFAISL